MLSQRLANLVFVLIVLCACGYFAWVAEGFTDFGPLGKRGAAIQIFPATHARPDGLCALIVGYAYLMRGAAGGDEGETVFADTREARQGLLMLGVTVACYVIWRNFGFLPMAVLLGPLSLLAMGVLKPVFYLVVFAMTALVTVIFTYGLGIQLI